MLFSLVLDDGGMKNNLIYSCVKFSIITPCFNSAKTIRTTIESVVHQTAHDIEYIIVDGGSTDGTLEIVQEYQTQFQSLVLISGPDRGIYDAMNKGIARATGKMVGILNSDDFYPHNEVLHAVEKACRPETDLCYGDIEYVDRENTKKVRIWRAGEYRREKLYHGWIMPHPAVFIKRELYENYGVFNLDFKIAADYELLLRFLKNNITVTYLPLTLVYMREGGYSAANFKRRRAGWQELKKAWLVNNLKVPPFFTMRRILSKLTQFFV